MHLPVPASVPSVCWTRGLHKILAGWIGVSKHRGLHKILAGWIGVRE